MAKLNTEHSRADRLREAAGWALVVVGLAVILGVGAAYGYNKTTVWVAGAMLILAGVLISQSVRLANFLNDILRF